jgi:hypothetical protein
MYLQFPIHGRHSNGIGCGISIAAARAFIQSFDWGASNIKMNAATLCRAAIHRLFAANLAAKSFDWARKTLQMMG